MFDSDSIWVLTDFTSNQIFSTKDSGKTWNELRLPGADGFVGIDVIDRLNGRIIDTKGKVWQTTDAGTNWSVLSTDFESSETKQQIFEVQKLVFTSEARGFLVDSFDSFKSNDAGKTWVSMGSKLEIPPDDLFFVQESVGWALVYNVPSGKALKDSSLIVYRTLDGGEKWQSVATIKQNLPDARLFFLDREQGWLTTSTGSPFLTIDGGFTWNKLQMPDRFSPRSIFWKNSQVGWSVGYTSQTGSEVWPREGKSAVFRSTDAGKNWLPIALDQEQPFFDKVYFSDENDGWIIGREKVYRTRDGGETWDLFLEVLPDPVQ